MNNVINAPWTDKQVENLKKWQECGHVHPFTCGGKTNGQDCICDLVPTKDGWICPICPYKQNWAHEMMLDNPTADLSDILNFKKD